MTTRICHNCGKNYPNNIEYCPYCNTLNICHQESQEKVKKEPRKGIEVHPCLKCGKVYDDNVEFCPYCHTVNRDYHPQTEIRAHKISASRVIKLICVGGIGLFLLVMLCGAISLCFYHPSSPNSSSFARNTQVVVDSQQYDSSSSSSAGYAQAVKTTATPQTTVAVTSISPTLQGANDDIKYLDAYQSSIQDMSSTDLMTAMNANDYGTIKTISTKRSTRAQFWYDKISPMSVSSQYQESKNAFLLFLSESIAHYNGITKGAQLYQDGKWAESTAAMREAEEHTNKLIDYLNLAKEKLPTSQSENDNQKIVYQQTVAVPTTFQSANDDFKYLVTLKDATHELGPIATAAGTALNSNDLSTAKTLGAKLSTRSQYWYNEIAPLSVSSKYQESKDALCISLSEQKAGGDLWVEMIQLLQDGKVSASNDKANEANQHLKKATIYLNLATAELPA